MTVSSFYFELGWISFVDVKIPNGAEGGRAWGEGIGLLDLRLRQGWAEGLLLLLLLLLLGLSWPRPEILYPFVRIRMLYVQVHRLRFDRASVTSLNYNNFRP